MISSFTSSPASAPLPSGSKEPFWSDQKRVLRAHVSPDRWHWLLDRASLTHRVQQACNGAFSVALLHQSWGRITRSEAQVLHLRHGERCLVREVQLRCAERPWVFARTIIPAPTLTGRQRRLGCLGTHPLGAVLFADPSMRRGPVQIAAITARHGIYARATQHLRTRPAVIWGRRSVFHVGGKPLLVSEFFLPGLGA